MQRLSVFRYQFSRCAFKPSVVKCSFSSVINPADKVKELDLMYRSQHLVLEDQLDEVERDLVRRRRMIYRSKQRGWLEVDILLGSFAAKFVPTLTKAELDEYELILEEETIDIFNFISGKDNLPARLHNVGILKTIQEYAYSTKVIDPEAYAKIKTENNLI